MTPLPVSKDDWPQPIRYLALRVRACEDGEPWPATELDLARRTWPVRDLLWLVEALQGEILGWTCDLRMEIALAIDRRDAHQLVHARPRALIDEYAEAHRRQVELTQWRHQLEATSEP